MMPIKSNQKHKHDNNFQNRKYIIKLKMTLTLYRRTWIVHLNSTSNNISIIMDMNLNKLRELVRDRKSWHAASLWGRRVRLEKSVAPNSSTLAWKIPWMEEPGRLQSIGSLRVRHDWLTWLSLFTFTYWRRRWQPTPVFLPGESQRRGAWWAAVYGVTQGRTQLKWLKKKKKSKDNCLWDLIVFYIEKNILVNNFWVFIDQALWSIISYKPQINPIWQVFCHMVGNIYIPHL